MRPKTERLLYMLLWGADVFMRPTFRNVTDSFEQWAYRSGLGRDLEELEAREFLERKRGAVTERIYRLTEKGRLSALGGRDPEKQWNRPWDGRWRLVLFDVPQDQHLARIRLTRYLRSNGLGNLQKSVWITPDPLTNFTKDLGRPSEDVGCLIALEASAGGKRLDNAIVSRAWNFERINELYQDCIRILKAKPNVPIKESADKERLLRWARSEQLAWLRAISADPLLPAALLPSGYSGREAWELRRRVLSAAGKLLA